MKLTELDAPETLVPPKIEKIGSRGRINIYIVDGEYIRRKIDDKFENYGQHYELEWIPENEFWIDRKVPKKDLLFVIEKLLYVNRLMSRGVKFQIANDVGEAALKAIKHKSMGGRTTDQFGGNPRQVYIRTWVESDGISVIIVDGSLVRNLFDITFFEGGHDLSCKYIPKNQVWIDSNVVGPERPYVLLEQLYERKFMSMGDSYKKAHRKASTIMYRVRHVPETLHSHLADLGVDISEVPE